MIPLPVEPCKHSHFIAAFTVLDAADILQRLTIACNFYMLGMVMANKVLHEYNIFTCRFFCLSVMSPVKMGRMC